MSTSPRKKRIAFTMALAGLASLAVWAGISSGALTNAVGWGSSAKSTHGNAAVTVAGNSGKAAAGAALTQTDDRPKVHIVVFKDAALASYQGDIAGLAPAPRKGSGRGRIDVASPQARAYVKHLETRQLGFETKIQRALGRPLQVTRRMQHAIDAIVTTLSPLEAEAISRLPEVRLVEAYREYPQDTDVGPRLIGANVVWDGIQSPIGDGPSRGRGEGIVVGIIDSGINFGSPSFAAVDPLDHYAHVNPNGAGNYLGTCATGGVDAGRCNNKLIGGYDFVCGAPGN
ncbi:MAG: protease domain-containing protein, partial [Pseudoxanthomonas sp.]